MNCPGCGADRTECVKTVGMGTVKIRWRRCQCGGEWRTEESVMKGSFRLRVATGNHGQPPATRQQPPATAGNPPATVGGVGGGLSSVQAPDPSGPVGASGSEGDPRTDRPRAKVPLYSADFVTFWSAYPRKTGKGAAWTGWQKAGPQLVDVLAALTWQRHTFEWRKDAGAFVPMPATYLNQRRWEDEPRGTPGTGPGAPPRAGMSVAEAEQRGILARRAAEQVERARQAEAEQFKATRDSDADALAPAEWMAVAKGANG